VHKWKREKANLWTRLTVFYINSPAGQGMDIAVRLEEDLCCAGKVELGTETPSTRPNQGKNSTRQVQRRQLAGVEQTGDQISYPRKTRETVPIRGEGANGKRTHNRGRAQYWCGDGQKRKKKMPFRPRCLTIKKGSP